MPALYPISVAAEDYKVGDTVKWYGSSTDISPYLGRVVAVSPKIQKVWVTWPIGETQQMAPQDLILITPFQGISVVPGDNGTSSYDKEISKKYFGEVKPVDRSSMVVKLASSFDAFVKMASRKDPEEEVINNFSKKASEMVATAIEGNYKNDLQAYSIATKIAGRYLPDEVIKTAINNCVSSEA